MDVIDALPIPVLSRKKAWLNKERHYAPEKLGVEMKVITDKVKGNVKKILSYLDIFLPAIGAELTLYNGATVEAIRFLPVLFMTHDNGD